MPPMCSPPPGRAGGDGDVDAQGTTSTQVPSCDSRIRGQAGAILLSDLGEHRQICSWRIGRFDDLEDDGKTTERTHTSRDPDNGAAHIVLPW